MVVRRVRVWRVVEGCDGVEPPPAEGQAQSAERRRKANLV